VRKGFLWGDKKLASQIFCLIARTIKAMIYLKSTVAIVLFFVIRGFFASIS
jgi:hypothetical protein